MEITIEEYKRLLEIETRVSVLKEKYEKSTYVNDSDVKLILQLNQEEK